MKLSPSSGIIGKLFATINQHNTQDCGKANLPDLKIADVHIGQYAFSHMEGSCSIGVSGTESFKVNTTQISFNTSNPTSHTALFTAKQQLDSIKFLRTNQQLLSRIYTLTYIRIRFSLAGYRLLTIFIT
jgi:hypothetical protein